MSVLEAFATVRGRAQLLVAGSFVSSDLERALQPLLAQNGVLRRPHLSAEEFAFSTAAVDACINLRDPAAGETSGIAIRAMGIGKAVLVTDAFPKMA
jgi:hypothetical protein